jgi:hypothetical protein
MTYRLHHANEREHAQKCIPTRQGKAQIKRLLQLRHDHRTKRNEHHVRGNDPDNERPVVSSEADRRFRMKVALDGESQQVRRCHQVFGEVVDKSRHCITKENNQDRLRHTSTRSSLNKFCDLGWFQERQVFNIAQPAKKDFNIIKSHHLTRVKGFSPNDVIPASHRENVVFFICSLVWLARFFLLQFAQCQPICAIALSTVTAALCPALYRNL